MESAGAERHGREAREGELAGRERINALHLRLPADTPAVTMADARQPRKINAVYLKELIDYGVWEATAT